MKKLQFLLVACLLCFLASSVLAQASWKIVSSSNTQVQSYTVYNLQAIKGGSYLSYELRKFGINLGWGLNAPKSNFQFVKEGGGPINCGDKVALFNDAGGYIKYGQRDLGINLVWSKKPVYEWEVRSVDNEKGTPIMTNQPIALYNSKANDFVRKCKRVDVTVDLAWVLDCPNGYKLPGAISDTKYNNMTRDQVVKHIAKIVVETIL